MTNKETTPVTIIQEGNSIFIAKHNPELPLGEILKGHFKKDPISEEIDKEGVRAFGDDTYVPTEEGEQCTWHNLFCNETFRELKMIWKEKSPQFKDIDTKWANGITQFKQDNILSIGDIRIRSVLMAFSSAVFYKTISWNTTGLLRKTRNLGVSFVLMGYVFVPELFNPFLQKRNLNKIK